MNEQTPISKLLLGGAIRTAKSGILIEQIDRVEFDDFGHIRIHGYVSNGRLLSHEWSERWTTLDFSKIDLIS